MRSPSEVTQQIQAVVPLEHKEKFARLVSDFSYKAIEQTGECWGQLSLLCNTLLGNRPLSVFSEEWQVEMITILTTMDKETLLNKGKEVS